ncbi:MAG TPA: type VII secretion protein EssC [Acetivibrio clariflavus]|nr:type VII secretion protein EssC [Acetivibrio clariflavus]
MSYITLYVLNKEHFKEYKLPISAEGIVNAEIKNYSDNGKIYKIPVYANDGHWSIYETDGLRIRINGKEIHDRWLAVGDVVTIESLDGEVQAEIYVDEYSKSVLSFDKYYIKNIRTITIGSSEENTIVYKGIGISYKHAVINVDLDRAEIKVQDDGRYIYVNGIKTQSKVLAFGDIISIMGLKIIYLDDIIAVNSYKPIESCNLQKFVDSNRIFSSDKSFIDNTKQVYFQRSPRIIKKLDEGQLEIDSPPSPNTSKEQPLILSIGPAFTMGMGMVVSVMFTIYSSRNNPFMVIPGIVTTACMLAGAVLWPFLSRMYNKMTTSKEEKRRVKKYRQYMQKIFAHLEERIERNNKILSSIYPEPSVLINRAVNRDRRLWERMPSNKDFLDIRLGLGQKPSLVSVALPKEHFSMEDDPLLDELKDINKNFVMVNNVPITISLLKNNMLGIIGEKEKTMEIVWSMIIQLSALHSYDEVKIVCIHGKHETEKLEWVRRLPHVWGPEKSIRFMASSRDEVRDVFLYLNDILNDREEKRNDLYETQNSKLPHFVVFITEPELVENEPIMRYLSNSAVELGVSTVFVYEKLNMLPKECNSFVQYSETECTLYHRDNPEDGTLEFKSDTVNKGDLNAFSYSLAGMKVKELASSLSLPGMLTFLEMYKVGRIEHMEIKRRWRENLSYRSLEAPLGIKAGGSVFYLNIHEKYHGPHGLIAGMTGSGKSEFIQSYILSMAINYHPHDVSFILIDYKGGGMANCFNGLPHVAGQITNLGGSQIRRSLVSLESELKRRQRIFAEYGVNHIDSYQQLYKERKAKEPLPHLIIISDEFAELKAQQPDFMDELVSAARIGRSLGVHLILATQKPSGVVDDQIWSNTSFRICLKVLDKSDSNEMLKRPEAASITQPGRCYVQVGNNEIFELIQSGWSGAPYIPTDKVENDSDKQVVLIDESARAIRTVSYKTVVDKNSKTQLSAIVDYISQYCSKEGIKPLKLWLDPLKEILFYQEINIGKGGWNGEGWTEVDHWITPVIGIYDDPQNQIQKPLKVNIGNDGHVIIFGAPGTGKTTLLQTMVYSLVNFYSPEILNLYFLDFGGRTMGYYNELPHTGGVVFSDDSDKLDKLLKMLVKELEARKRRFSEYGVGNLQSYLEISNSKEPAIVVIIDNYSAFYELYPDHESIIMTLTREGGNYGIFLIITATNTNDIKYKIQQNIKLLYALQLNDKFEYQTVVGNTNGLEPENVKGRGLAKIGTALEFQTALAGSKLNEADRIAELRQLFRQMKEKWTGEKAKPIPFVPEELTLDLLLSVDEAQEMMKRELIPIGYNMEDAQIISIDVGKALTYTILGFDQAGKTNLLKVMIRVIKEKFNWKVYVVDNERSELKKYSTQFGVDGYINNTEDFDTFMKDLIDEMLMRNKDLKAFRQNSGDQSEQEYMRKYRRIVVLIDNFNDFFSMASDEAMNYIENIMEGGSGLEVYFVFTADPDKISTYLGQPIYDYVFNGKSGILLGGSMDSQNVFSVNMSYQQRTCQYDSGMGYLIDKNNYWIIKTPLV